MNTNKYVGRSFLVIEMDDPYRGRIGLAIGHEEGNLFLEFADKTQRAYQIDSIGLDIIEK